MRLYIYNHFWYELHEKVSEKNGRIFKKYIKEGKIIQMDLYMLNMLRLVALETG